MEMDKTKGQIRQEKLIMETEWEKMWGESEVEGGLGRGGGGYERLIDWLIA